MFQPLSSLLSFGRKFLVSVARKYDLPFLERHSSTLEAQFLVSMARKLTSLHSTPPPRSGGSCHVGSMIVTPPLCSKTFSVDGKEGRFAPLPAEERWGMSCHDESSLLHFFPKCLVSMARKVASLHSPPRNGGSCHVGSSIVNFGRKFIVSVARKVALIHSPPRTGGACHIGSSLLIVVRKF